MILHGGYFVLAFSTKGLILSLLCNLWYPFCIGTDTGNLLFVNVLSRHGDRSPLHTYYNDSHVGYWKNGPGQLTEVGLNQSKEFGEFLRERYGSFMSRTYKNVELYAKSVDHDRNLQSMYATLTTLYTANHFPIPVHTESLDKDNVLNAGAHCDKYNKLLSESVNSDLVKNYMKKNETFLKRVARYAKISSTSIEEFWHLFDPLICEKLHNLKLPSWVTEEVFERLNSLKEFKYAVRYNGREMTGLRAGQILHAFTDNMNRIVGRSHDIVPGGANCTRVVLYSSSDTLLGAVLKALNIYDGLPAYMSALLIELHNATTDGAPYTVEVYHKHSTNATLKQVLIPGCGSPCTLEKFEGIIQPFIHIHWNAACRLHNNEIRGAVYGVYGASAVCGFLLLVVLACHLRRVYKKHEQKSGQLYTTIQHDEDT